MKENIKQRRNGGECKLGYEWNRKNVRKRKTREGWSKAEGHVGCNHKGRLNTACAPT